MTELACETDIEAPIDYVFKWGTNFENLVRCMPSVVDIEILDKSEESLKVRKTMKVLGQTVTSEELYMIDQENKLATPIFHEGDISGELVFDYFETDTGTKVRVEGDMELATSEFGQDIQTVVPGHIKRQFENTLKTMKELTEAEYPEIERTAVPSGSIDEELLVNRQN